VLPEDPEDVPELAPPSEFVEDEPLALEPPDEEPLEAAKAGAPASMSADIRTATCADFIVHFLQSFNRCSGSREGLRIYLLFGSCPTSTLFPTKPLYAHAPEPQP
jgi:hypothetical protein